MSRSMSSQVLKPLIKKEEEIWLDPLTVRFVSLEYLTTSEVRLIRHELDMLNRDSEDTQRIAKVLNILLPCLENEASYLDERSVLREDQEYQW